MDPSDLMLAHYGDTHVQGDLMLDWDKGWANGEILVQWAKWNRTEETLPSPRVSGIVVFGNVDVAGSIINADGDSGLQMIVLGDLRAKNLVCGGSFIEIKGDAMVSEAVFAHYNHGELRIWGALVTKVLINDDHCVSFDLAGVTQSEKGNGRPKNGGFLHISSAELRDSVDEDEIPKPLKRLVSKKLLTWSDICAKLFTGQSILRAGDDSPPATVEEWVRIVWNNPMSLRKVPKDLRTESFYLTLLSSDAPFSEQDAMELVAMIPGHALTHSVRIAALELAPKSLLRLPESFDLHAEYEQCFMHVKDPARVYEGIPHHYRSVSMEDRIADL